MSADDLEAAETAWLPHPGGDPEITSPRSEARLGLVSRRTARIPGKIMAVAQVEVAVACDKRRARDPVIDDVHDAESRVARAVTTDVERYGAGAAPTVLGGDAGSEDDRGLPGHCGISRVEPRPEHTVRGVHRHEVKEPVQHAQSWMKPKAAGARRRRQRRTIDPKSIRSNADACDPRESDAAIA